MIYLIAGIGFVLWSIGEFVAHHGDMGVTTLSLGAVFLALAVPYLQSKIKKH